MRKNKIVFLWLSNNCWLKQINFDFNESKMCFPPFSILTIYSSLTKLLPTQPKNESMDDASHGITAINYGWKSLRFTLTLYSIFQFLTLSIYNYNFFFFWLKITEIDSILGKPIEFNRYFFRFSLWMVELIPSVRSHKKYKWKNWTKYE